MFDVFRNSYDEFLSALLEHIEISFIAIVTAIVLAIFVTIFLNFYKTSLTLTFPSCSDVFKILHPFCSNFAIFS